MTEEQILSPSGLHAETEESDFSAKFEEQQENAVESTRHRNGAAGNESGLADVIQEVAKATSSETRTKLVDVHRKLGANVDKLLASLPAKIKKANLGDTVSALTKLVPLMGEIDGLLSRKSPQDLMDEIRKRAQSKLRKKVNGANSPTD